MLIEHGSEMRLEIGDLDISPSTGRIEVIDGCMCSGKSKELIRRISILSHSINARILSGLEEEGVIFKDIVAVFKPCLDNRRGDNTVNSRDGDEAPAISITNVEEIGMYLLENPKTRVIAIDEAQFFNGQKLMEISKLAADVMGLRVIVAGLGKDFKGATWGGVLELGSIADEHVHLTAACAICGGEAEMTQRLIFDSNKKAWLPAHINDPVELVGEEQYQARCRKHHQVRTD